MTDQRLLLSGESWNHNNHFHKYILSLLPERVGTCLDVGCGNGFFAARLAIKAARMVALDNDITVLRQAVRLQNDNLAFLMADFLEHPFAEASFDVITSIASLHHLDLLPALTRMKMLLKPGGRLVVIGLYREVSPIDWLFSLVNILLDFLQKHLCHRHPDGLKVLNTPIRKPQRSINEIRRAAAAILPGANLHRQFYWRYSLVWQKPF